MKYKVELNATIIKSLLKTITVSANDRDEALDKARNIIYNTISKENADVIGNVTLNNIELIE